VHNVVIMSLLTYDQISKLSILRQFYYLLWRLIGVNIALVSPDLKRSLAFGATESWSLFCVALRKMGGEKNCLACDAAHLQIVSDNKQPLQYHCWAGLREFIAPIMLDGQILTFIQCGQVLDESPTEQDWEIVSKKIAATGIDSSLLREQFFQLRAIPSQTQQDLMALLELLGNYIAQAQYQVVQAEATQQSRLEERALSYIRNHFTEPIGLDDVAEAACTSKRNLSRIFKSKSGLTVLEVIQQMRITEACRLLQNGDTTCAKAAFDCGFGTVQQFNRVFRKIKDCTPHEWQRMHSLGITGSE
jgi:AraC-like DNA-binding protein/ligand-binding sensor protein